MHSTASQLGISGWLCGNDPKDLGKLLRMDFCPRKGGESRGDRAPILASNGVGSSIKRDASWTR